MKKLIQSALIFHVLLLGASVASPDSESTRAVVDDRSSPSSIEVFGNTAYAKICNALANRCDADFEEMPLNKVLAQLSDDHDIPIWIDEQELKKIGEDSSTLVTLKIPPVMLRSALTLILSPLDLDFVYHNEVLCITTKSHVNTIPLTLIYKFDSPYSGQHVADLIQKTAESTNGDGPLIPVVQLLSLQGQSEAEGDLFVRANKYTHADIRDALELLTSRTRR